MKPIHEINPVSLFQELVIAKRLFNMTLMDEIQVLRKTVVYGSNTSGFQRTCLVAIGNKDSYITVNSKKFT